MEIKIAGYTVKLYNEVRVTLSYDDIADTFSFALFFNPDSQRDREIFRPYSYHPCTITHGGVLLMTGTVLSHSFASAGDPPKQLVYISGYSSTGVLHDSCVLNTIPDPVIGGIPTIEPKSETVAVLPAANEYHNITLQQITEKVTTRYLIHVKVDKELIHDTAFITPYPTVSTKPDETVESFLRRLCKPKNIILSHDATGNLLLTRVKADKIVTTEDTLVDLKPISVSSDLAGAPKITSVKQKQVKKSRGILYNFTTGKWLKMVANYNGQPMHGLIQIVGQSSSGNPDNALDSAIKNPYVFGNYRYTRIIQTSGDDNDTVLNARQALGEELKNMSWIITIQGWTLGGNMVMPNQLVTVINPDLFLFKTTTLFIQEVTFFGDSGPNDTAVLKCVLPECFGNDPVKNIFE